jgi:hypothetical protein
MGRTCSTYGVRGDVHLGFWCGKLRGRDHLEDPDVDGNLIIKWTLKKWDLEAWTGLSWLRIGTGGGHPYVGFHNMRGTS